jgi:D-alanyl-D-alanine carboxypeptidase
MAQDKVGVSKISKLYDREAIPGVKFDAATQLGVVKDNLSPGRDGRLRVWIPDFGGDETNPQMWRKVSYASPYAGVTYQPSTSKNNSFTGTQHSYGMWMVPPDIGNLVLCTFVNGDPERGFWFACVPNHLSNWMTPGLAAGNVIDYATASDDVKGSLVAPNDPNPQYLPCSEFNENIEANTNGTFYNNAKPIHEYQAKVLIRQGLDRDKVRGAISSSSQRETPSHVFGISTPGRALTKDPADDPNYADKVAAGGITSDQYAVPTRKGGHTFVMDDGDVNGIDQLIRLRTSEGHTLLMNDAENIIFIINKDGTSWVELNDTGVNVYTSGAFNVRAEGDINMHSDTNVNIQAKGRINMDSGISTNITSGQINIGGSDGTLIYGAKTQIGGASITVSSDGKLLVSSGGGTTIEGSTIDINGGVGGNSITNPAIEKNVAADATYDAGTKEWSAVPSSTASIVSGLPAHQPWVRTGALAPVERQAQSTICPPRTGAPAANYNFPASNGNKLDRGTINGIAAPWTTDEPFLAKVKDISAKLNLNYLDMLACMNLETGRTYDPAITNSLGYTGLIQFGNDSGARLCGTTCADLRRMDRVTQCDYVYQYFVKNRLAAKAPNPRLVDIYLTILWPAAVGRADDYVVFPAGSNTYKANPGFDPGGKVGYITVGMIATAIAIHLTEVKQALANAGVAGPGQVSSGTGVVITDGSGKPVTTGAGSTGVATTDQGIINSIGKQLQGNTCPLDTLNAATTYNPSADIGDMPQLIAQQVKAMMAELGYFESGFTSTKINGTSIGKYQVDAKQLYIAGYVTTPTSTLSSNSSWYANLNGISSQYDFFKASAFQDIMQYNEFKTNYTALIANGGIKSDDDICTAAGMLFVAHQFRSVELAKKWRDTDTGTDALGRTGDVYFNQGRYAIDVLYASALASLPTLTARSATPNTSGIDTNAVLRFANQGSGTQSNFDQLDSDFKSRILKMAQDYKDKTGSSVTITSAYRSAADQERIYQSWLAAGGHIPDRPTAGGITTPAKPVSAGGKGSPHNSGVAIDSSESKAIARTVDLAQYGLRWGGTFSKPDDVHIQLSSVTP